MEPRPGAFDRLETSAGGAGRRFETTQWSRLLSPGENPYAGLRHLAEHYWKPIYCFIRARERCSNEDAKDLTQTFFVWVLESGFLAKADPRVGRFRSFLRTALTNFLTDRRRGSATQKRGGLARLLSLDAMAGTPPDRGSDPDAAMDLQWRESVLERAQERLGESFRAEGKERWVALWREYDLSVSPPDYDLLAGKYGISKREVSYWLTTVRRKFQEILVDLVSQTVTDPESLQAELRDLFGS